MPVINNHGDSPAAEPTTCAGCGVKIVDRFYLLAVDRQWHVHCLKCCECKLRLDSELTCFARDGNIYCKDDYYRLFAMKRCARCHLGISSNELVMRARDLVYHLHCFNCASCNKALTKGEQFGMRDNMVYCRLHYELLVQQQQQHELHDGYRRLPSSASSSSSFYNGVGTVQKGRPRKRKVTVATTPPLLLQHDSDVIGSSTLRELLPDGSELCSLDQVTSGGGYDTAPTTPPTLTAGPQPRTKRMRTSFKHHQLRTMKSYFALNQNPDAKDLKQLAQKTGLSKRVLQVWFQNARAKWRRNMMRQENNQGGDKSSSDITDLGAMAATPTVGDLPADSQSPTSLTFGDLY